MGQFIERVIPAHQPNNTNLGAKSSLVYASDICRYNNFVSAFSIKFPLRGSLPYLIDNQKVEVQPGSFFLANQGREMECLPCLPGSEVVFVNFTPSLMTDAMNTFSEEHCTLLDNPNMGGSGVYFFERIYRVSKPISGLIMAQVDHLRTDSDSAPDELEDFFFNLSAVLLKEQIGVKSNIEQISATKLSTREELYRRVMAAHDFMLDQWNGSLTLSSVSTHACLSAFHFQRTFREVHGISPMSFYRKAKLQKAKELLHSGKWTVTKVAQHCGFSDVFTFSKAFKREWGRNPSEMIGHGTANDFSEPLKSND